MTRTAAEWALEILEESILDALRKYSWRKRGTNQIAGDARLGSGTTRDLLYGLAEKGLVIDHGDGWWQITPGERE